MAEVDVVEVREAVARLVEFFGKGRLTHSRDYLGNITVSFRFDALYPQGAELPSFVEALVNAKPVMYRSAQEVALEELFVNLLGFEREEVRDGDADVE